MTIYHDEDLTLKEARRLERFWHQMFKQHNNNDDWIKWRKYAGIVASWDLEIVRQKMRDAALAGEKQ